MEHPKISIIVPVYNAEAYIHKCIKSLLSQTFEDYEIILVNDGSSDRSKDICEDFAAFDNRIKLINTINGGVARARQIGLDSATGEYVIHADPDDWVEDSMLQDLYTHAEKNQVDVVICDFWYEFPNRSVYSKQQPKSFINKEIQKQLFTNLHGSTCNKLIKLESIKENNIRFDERLSYCEDLHFILNLLQSDVKVSYLPKAYYHYDRSINTNSIARSLYSKKDYDKMVMTKQIFDDLTINMPCHKICSSNFAVHIVRRAFLGGYFSDKEFVEYCSIYKKECLSNPALKLIWKLLLRISLIGHYKSALKIYEFLRSLRPL